MSLPENMQHTHSGMGGDGPKIRAVDLDWNGYTGSGGPKIFAFDFWGLSGGTGDGSFRNVLFPCKDGDMQVLYNAIVLEGQATSINARWTMRYTTSNYDGIKTLTLKPGEILELTGYFYSSTSNLRLNTTGGSYRLLAGTSTTLTSVNPNVSIINASASDMTITFQYATSASDRPIFGLMCKIY